MKKIMMVFAVLLVGLLAISAVSAETDAAGTDSSTEGVESTDDAVLGSSGTDELQNDNEPLSVDAGSDKLEMGEGEVLGKDINVTGDSFTDIEKAINESEAGDIIYLQGGNFTGNGSQIIINKDLTIIGGFKEGDGIYATLDAQRLSRIFEINARVTLQGIKFINGNSTDNGGAIYVAGDCTLTDCIFTNNYAANNGGAVYWNTAAVGITNCTFENNTANNGGASYFNGEVTGVTLTGNFSNNSAERAGGALYFAKKSSNNTIAAEFYNNNAKEASGGAIFYRMAENNIFESVFRYNHAVYGAGIFFYNKANNNRFNSDFRFNVAESCGGAMFFYSTTDGNNFSGYFINNSALGKVDEINGNGGAITFKNTSSNSIFTCDFVNNTGVRNGGGVNYRQTPYNITFNSNFINNVAESGGGVNFFETFENVVFNGKFINNSADFGGGIAVKNGFIENISFWNNSAGNGGAIYFDDSGKVSNCEFNNNNATIGGYGDGGAIYFSNDGIVTNCNFTNNKAVYYSGAVYFGKDGFVNNSNFKGNDARDGGSVYIFGEGKVYNSNFTDNHARIGGAIEFWGNGLINNSRFNDNSAIFSGGAVYCSDDVEINGCILNNNSAIEYAGGGVCFYDGGKITHCIFTNNSAVNGGAIFWLKNRGMMSDVVFWDNSAKENGGANYFRGAVTNVNLDGNFINNTANYGGANYFAGEVTNVTLSGNFTDNSAKIGGGANYFKMAVNNVTLTGNFTNNRAETGDGGANCFYDEVTNITLSGNFINNTAGDGSGGVNNFDNIVTNISLSGNFTDNFALYDGGANCFYGDVTTGYFSGNFINNRAGRDGGANEFSRYIFDVTLSGNFINNTAGRNGGANEFYWDVTNVNLTGVFINNTAEKGSAHYFDYDLTNVIIAGNFINNNESSVIYIANSVSGNVIRDSIFLNNGPINVTEGSVDAFDNWFGNNVTDYDVAPDVGIDLDNWLFINGTADPNPVSAAESSDVIFNLSRYDGEVVSSYDNSRLIPINLTVTSTRGSVNKNKTGLDESITYMPDSAGAGSVTVSIENVFCTIDIENQKAEPDMSIESAQSYAGENATITVTLPSKAEGNVTVTDAYGNNYTQPVKNGTVDIEVPNLPVGMNKLNVTYSGDNRYFGKTEEYEIQVDMMPTYLLVENIEMYQGDGTKYVVTLIDGRENPIAGMGIKVNITGKTYTIITDENGTAVLPINLKPAVHPATAFFNGKGNYTNATPISTNVTVMTKVRIDQHKDLIKDYGDVDKFTVHAVDKFGKSVGAYAKVKMTIAGKTYTVCTDENGYASLPINLKPGTYDITCEYAGYTVKHKVTVKQVLSATNRQYKKASSYQFTATLKHSNGKAISGKTVTFTVKGKTYTQTTNTKGEATITIKEALNLGTYNIAIRYLDSIISKTITIK